MTKNNIFILSYSRAQQFFNEVEQDSRFTYYFIDNNKQSYKPTISCATHTTARNIGCAGGWNLICKIAFDFLGLEKIIITQDDCILDYTKMQQALAECTPTRIVGVIQPFFEFSCFAIHRDTYKTVGDFDENCIYVYCEDADYKQRCRLLNITIDSLYASNQGMNQSASIKDDPSINRLEANKEYLKFKWGRSIHPSSTARADFQPPYENTSPFSPEMAYDYSFPIRYIPLTKRITRIYGDLDFPSAIEYERFKNNGFFRC
jgi:hypothetical protein